MARASKKDISLFGGIIVIDTKKVGAVKASAASKVDGVVSIAGDKAGLFQRKVTAAVKAIKSAE